MRRVVPKHDAAVSQAAAFVQSEIRGDLGLEDGRTQASTKGRVCTLGLTSVLPMSAPPAKYVPVSESGRMS